MSCTFASSVNAGRRLVLGAALVSCIVPACAVDEERGEPEPLGETSAALSNDDAVSTAVAQSCTTAAVKGLALQLVAEIQCLHPNALRSIANTPGLSLGDAAANVPFLQPPVADALVAAQKQRGTTMSINSGLRTIAQQYLLYRWYETGRCGIALAAKPGSSNHESGLAVDVEDDEGWRAAMENHGFKWFGSADPVHYDYVASGAIALRGLSIKAFQRLWNENHPEDPISEDGTYGPDTETRLARAPVGGFPKGANCTNSDAGRDDAGPDQPADVTPVPDGDEPAAADGGDPSGQLGRRSSSAGDGGCASAPGRPGWSLGALAAIGAAVFLRRRRARRTT